MKTNLKISGRHYGLLRSHLFPPDGKEAVAVALCGRRHGQESHGLCVYDLVLIPHEGCSERSETRVSWPTSLLVPSLQQAMNRQWAVLKIHSHRGHYAQFSGYDDASDRDLFSSVYGWMDSDLPHASAVMLPDGQMFGRVVTSDGQFLPLSLIAVAGVELHFWHHRVIDSDLPEFTLRHAQAFGKGTTERLRRLTVAVIGCSGTGSPVVEQLARLGVGKLILVDPDKVEEKNLNRILNATMDDALAGRFKIDVAADAVVRMKLGTEVIPVSENIVDPRVVRLVAESHVVFGCMDGAEGRNLLNRLATFYCIPYFDVGVRLEADGCGGISQVCGSVNYLQPGGSSLLSRKVITPEEIAAEGLKRTDPAAYAEQVKARYIKGVREDRPAVVSVNMLYASLAVNEFLARLHPYRDDGNDGFAWFGSSLTQARFFQAADGEPCPSLSRHVGRGDTMPPLDMPALSE
jgi:hypothetical protein